MEVITDLYANNYFGLCDGVSGLPTNNMRYTSSWNTNNWTGSVSRSNSIDIELCNLCCRWQWNHKTYFTARFESVDVYWKHSGHSSCCFLWDILLLNPLAFFIPSTRCSPVVCRHSLLKCFYFEANWLHSENLHLPRQVVSREHRRSANQNPFRSDWSK